MLPDPHRSRVVLVGASRFTHLAELPAVITNIAVLQELLTSEEVWKLPTGHCTVVRDPQGPRAVSQAVKQAAREATDTLLFYYSGHGLIDPGTGELYLALHDSQVQEVYDSAVPYEWIRRPFQTSRAARRVVVLDCCYSGRMLGAMSEGLGLAEIDGTYLLAAAAENALALAPPGERHTAFTGEFVDLLRRGVPEAGESLTLNEIYERMRSSLRAAERPEPQCRDRNSLGMTPFVPNPACEPRTGVTKTPEAVMRRLVSDVSHELRTPLTTITMATELLEEKSDQLDPLLRGAVEMATAETRRLGDLVDALLELSRYDAGVAELLTEEVDVTKEVVSFLDAREWTDLVVLDAPNPIRAQVDTKRLNAVLAELIGNALRHGDRPITVSLASRPTEFVIEVSDSGNGIPESTLPYIFDRFVKGDSRRPRSEGSGLGLSIAREAAHLMGGDIRAANRVGGGARFTLRLPLQRHDRQTQSPSPGS